MSFLQKQIQLEQNAASSEMTYTDCKSSSIVRRGHRDHLKAGEGSGRLPHMHLSILTYNITEKHTQILYTIPDIPILILPLYPGCNEAPMFPQLRYFIVLRVSFAPRVD